MDWDEEDDDWVNDDVLANIDSIVAQHQSKQQARGRASCMLEGLHAVPEGRRVFQGAACC
jgi:hypothetical protein